MSWHCPQVLNELLEDSQSPTNVQSSLILWYWGKIPPVRWLIPYLTILERGIPKKNLCVQSGVLWLTKLLGAEFLFAPRSVRASDVLPNSSWHVKIWMYTWRKYPSPVTKSNFNYPSYSTCYNKSCRANVVRGIRINNANANWLKGLPLPTNVTTRWLSNHRCHQCNDSVLVEPPMSSEYWPWGGRVVADATDVMVRGVAEPPVTKVVPE